MLTKLTVDIEVKRAGRVHPFKKGDVVNPARWPEIVKAMEALERREARKAPTTKEITETEVK